MDPQQRAQVGISLDQVNMVAPSDVAKGKRSFTKWLLLLLSVLIVLMVGGLFFFNSVSKRHTAYAPTISPTPMQQGGIPTATKTTDLAPELPNNQKTVLTIENSDSSLEKIILPTVQVTGYTKALPEGARVISQTPAQ